MQVGERFGPFGRNVVEGTIHVRDHRSLRIGGLRVR
jgi:hypothetical protein